MLTAAAYDIHVEQLFSRMRLFHEALARVGVPYRIVGGLAVFIHVYAREPLRARVTADIDAAIERSDLERVIAAGREIGLEYRPVAGVDMLVDAGEPRARSAIHLIFLGERVRPGSWRPCQHPRPNVPRMAC